MASLGFLHQLVNEKMEAVQVWERRTIKKLHVQVLLQTLKIRPRDPAQLHPGMGVWESCQGSALWLHSCLGLQTPLTPGCSLHCCDRGFLGCWRFLLGDLWAFGCSRNGLLRWPLGMVVTAALCGRDLARLRSPLRFQMKYFSFMWSSFTSCS